MKKINIFWFRRDLRLKDNHGLYMALKSGLPVVPIFIFDSNILSLLPSKKDSRVEFIFNELMRLNGQLKEKGNRSVQVFFDDPLSVFEELKNTYQVCSVFFNEDYEPYATQRDLRVSQFLRKYEIHSSSFKDHLIFSPKEVLKADHSPYLVYTPFKRAWMKRLKESSIAKFPSENHLDQILALPPKGPRKLSELGFQSSEISIPSKSLYKSVLRSYAETRNFPAQSRGTSMIGVHLRFGTMSVRHCVKEARLYSRTWLDELIWREFFSMILFHFPDSINSAFKSKYSKIPWREDYRDFLKWCEGKTGYPFVDAGMRELVATGHMHNRVRMVTASFLCKHLLLPWTWGERFFAQHLLDFDLASNVGNWQWAAGCGVDAAPYFRIFNPQSQMNQFDPQQTYVKRWVPELNGSGYFEPMVDHEYARRRALMTYKKNLE